MAESQSFAQRMSALINKGKPNDALKLTSQVAIDNEEWNDANYWFHVALASQLQGLGDGLVNLAWGRAKECVNYSRQMEGDFHRDAAIATLKQGKPVLARQELQNAYDIHVTDGDWLRIAADDMVRGRIRFVTKDYDAALMWHDGADRVFVDALTNDPENETARQWLLNNQYHRLRTFRMAKGAPWTHATDDFDDIMEWSHDRRQRMGARFAYFGGRLGIWLFDRFVEPRFVH